MRAVLLAGGNLGDVRAALDGARAMLAQKAGPVTACSGVYESEAWGFEAAERFLNQAWVVETPLQPEELLDAAEAVERAFGRTDKGAPANGRVLAPGQRTYRSRTMDIDILFYGQRQVDSARLKVPHPLLHRREFALLPLREVVPEWVHPGLGKTVEELWLECRPALG